jgi:peroxiredoxin
LHEKASDALLGGNNNILSREKLMKTILFAVLAAFAFSVTCPAAESTNVATELRTVVQKVKTKLGEGKKTEADLADEMKEFDKILAAHKDEKTDDVAQVLMMKAMLYFQVLDNTDKSVELIEQLKRDYPETTQGKNADEILENIKKQAEAKKLRSQLVDGAKFPDFDEKDLEGKPLSVANYKGKVVLIDFWATWCPPCVAELPNVQKAYETHHKDGFEIIGISLDQDEKKLKSFIKEKNMPWPQYFDGKGWGSKLAGKYGVTSIPATFLLDREGKIIGTDLRGPDLETALTKALAKK